MMHSISLLLILSLFVFELTECMKKQEAKSTLETFGSSCEPAPTDDDYEAMLTNAKEPPQSAKCFRLCLMKMGNLFTEDGKIDVEQSKSYIGMMYEGKEDVGEKITTTCNEKVNNSDECEAAHLYGMCFIEEMESNGLKIETFEE